MAIRLIGQFDDLDHPTLITAWSVVHIMTGALGYVMWRRLFSNLSFPMALFAGNVIHGLYEFTDILKTYTVNHNPERWLRGRRDKNIDENTLPNTIADHLLANAGFCIAAYFGMQSNTYVIVFVAAVIVMLTTFKAGYTD
jgi:hypothetical protein